MGSFARDVRYAIRSLARHPSFLVIAVSTLALGIGANTALFSVVDGVLLRPLPYREPHRLVALWETVPEKFRVAPANYLDWRAQAGGFESMGAFGAAGFSLTGVGDSEQVEGVAASRSYFETLGRSPLLGRTFLARDEEPGAERAVILGHGLWQRRFGGDPAIVGQTLFLDGQVATVVGVMPPGLYPSWPSPAGKISFSSGTADFWVPLQLGSPATQSRKSHVLGVIARLKEGVDLQGARDEMAVLGERLAAAHPDTNAGEGALVVPLLDEVVGSVRPALFTLLGAVGLVLLVACANVASLLLARSAVRARELAIRGALGAGRGRLLRQLLSEGLLLGLLGCAAGCLLAAILVEPLVALMPHEVPRLSEVALDARVLAFAVGLSLLTSVLFSVVPALQASAQPPLHALKQGSASALGQGRQRLQGALVVAEVATALVLVTGGGLLFRSFLALRQVDPGFDPEGVITARLVLPAARYRTPERLRSAYGEILERFARLPRVDAVALAYDRPLESNWIDTFTIDGEATTPEPRSALLGIATPDYFRTLRIPLVRGRSFHAGDDLGSPGVAMVNEAFVRRHFDGEDPLGRTLVLPTPRANWGAEAAERFEIVGVARDVRSEGLASPPEPAFFLPAAQFPVNELVALVRVRAEPLALLPALRVALRGLDPDLPLARIATLPTLVAADVAQPRFTVLLAGLFAVLGLLLSAGGLYALLSHAVALRTREIGLRMALGAPRGDVLRLMMGQGLRLVAFGIGIGVFGAAVLSRLLSSLLFGVTAADPGSFGVAAVVLGLAGLAACAVPARRASRVDPMVALRAD